MTVRDIHPVSSRDPSGVVFFYVALASVIMGFIGTIQTRSNAPALTLIGELRWDLLRAVTVSLAITAVVGPVARLEPVPFLPTWGVLALTSLTAGMTYACWRLLIGNRWAMLPTWLLFVLISSPASGGAVADPLLPPVLAAIGRFLPTGATVSILRDTTYFAAFPNAVPYVVLVVWAVVTSTGWVLLRRHRVGTGVPPSVAPLRRPSRLPPSRPAADPWCGEIRPVRVRPHPHRSGITAPSGSGCSAVRMRITSVTLRVHDAVAGSAALAAAARPALGRAACRRSPGRSRRTSPPSATGTAV